MSQSNAFPLRVILLSTLVATVCFLLLLQSAEGEKKKDIIFMKGMFIMKDKKKGSLVIADQKHEEHHMPMMHHEEHMPMHYEHEEHGHEWRR